MSKVSKRFEQTFAEQFKSDIVILTTGNLATWLLGVLNKRD